MSKERVLDIGIGSGGTYIRRNTIPTEQRIGIDVDRRSISVLRRKYPDVIPVVASAEHLPFTDSTFPRIEIVLPFNELMIPGLQNDHFALNQKWKDEYAQTHPDGWYPEFQRVLIPHGELVIFADLWTDPKQVEKTSQRFFEVEQVRQLTVAEFRALGTSTVEKVIANGRRSPFIDKTGKKWEDTLVEINLRSTKSAIIAP